MHLSLHNIFALGFSAFAFVHYEFGLVPDELGLEKAQSQNKKHGGGDLVILEE